MGVDVTLLGFAAVLGGTSLLAFAAGRTRGDDGVPTLEAWALADRRYGAFAVWLLLGGTIYTAYTFAAVPGLVYGAGAIGFFALPYTIVVYPLAFWMLPKLWSVSAEHGFITVADYARGRWGSHPLALAIALTGLLATMPYVALQLLGIRAVLQVGGIYPDGAAGDALLAVVFGVLAVATYRSGLRAPALIAVVKCTLVVSVAVGVSLAALDRLGGPGAVFAVGQAGAATPAAFASSLDPSLHMAYATLALGSAMALLVYPHVLTAAFSASSAGALRRCVVAMPLSPKSTTSPARSSASQRSSRSESTSGWNCSASARPSTNACDASGGSGDLGRAGGRVHRSKCHWNHGPPGIRSGLSLVDVVPADLRGR